MVTVPNHLVKQWASDFYRLYPGAKVLAATIKPSELLDDQLPGERLLHRLFHAEGLARDLVYLFCGPLSLLFFFNGLIFVANATCNNLGAAFQSTLVNWGRHTLGTLPFALWGAQHWGAPGVLVGQAAGGILFGLLAVVLALRVIRRRSATI